MSREGPLRGRMGCTLRLLPEAKAKTRHLGPEEHQALPAAFGPSTDWRGEWQDARDLVVSLAMTGDRGPEQKPA